MVCSFGSQQATCRQFPLAMREPVALVHLPEKWHWCKAAQRCMLFGGTHPYLHGHEELGNTLLYPS